MVDCSYPAVYFITVFPNTISRWLYFSHVTVPYQFTFFANTLFALSGALNVLLFWVTRPDVVVGQKTMVEELPLNRKGFEHFTSKDQGYLPTRSLRYEKSASDAHVEGHTQDEWTLPNHAVHQSPSSRCVHLPPSHLPQYPLRIAGGEYYISTERFEYRGSSPVDEDDDYGHLPPH